MSTEELNYDVLIIGAGPAGLAAAIKIKQLAADSSSPIDVCVIDKAAELGGHTLSGAVIDTTSLSELMPDWRDQKSPINIKVMQDKFHFFTEQSAITIPNYLLPNTLKNKDCYVVSLSNVVKWLGKRAEMLGVDIFTGFAAKELIFDKNNG